MMSSQKKHTMDFNTIILLIIIGFVTGILGGMVGVGGGIILVPALVFILGFSQMKAQGTSLALIMFPVGLLAVIQYYKEGHVDFKIVALLALGFIIGSFLGSKLSLSMPQQTVKKIFALLMLVIACKMLFFDKTQNNKETQLENSNKPPKQ